MLIQGDSYELIKDVSTESVNLVITSPPYYRQRTYTDDKREIGNENTVVQYIDKLLIMFNECLRVLRNDGSIIWNLGDKYIKSNLQLIPYRFAIAASERATLVNNISWVKSNPTPKQFKRRLVSSHEPFFHFVKTNGYFYNLPEEIPERKIRPEHKDSRYFSMIEKSDLTEEQKWKATKELCKVIGECASGKLNDFRMKIKGIHSPPYGGQQGGRMDQLVNNGFTIIRMQGRKMQKDVLDYPVENVKWKKHPAIYPQRIVEKFLQMLTKEHDTVLDPFMGSGTTAVACQKCNRNFIGFELCREFVEETTKRLEEK